MNKHKVIIKGIENRKIYKFGTAYYYSHRKNHRFVYEIVELIAEKTLWEGDIDTPLLEKGETLRIEELGVEVIISRRDRSTSGAYVYKTNYEFKLVEDEKTAESKRGAELEEEKYRAAEATLHAQRKEEMESKIEPVEEKRSWWKKLFS